MRSSRFYQNCLQFVARTGEVAMFISGIFLGKEQYFTALIIFSIRIVIGTTTSELMYKRMQAVTREELHRNQDYNVRQSSD